MRLSEIAEIKSGLVVARKKAKLQVFKQYKLLTLKSIQEGNIINEEFLDLFDSSEELSNQYLTQEGDIIIRLSYPHTAVYINKDNEGILISSLFNIIRLKNEDNIKREFLTIYLNNCEMKKNIARNSIGSTISIIKSSFIKNIKIENIPIDKQEKLIQINKAHLKETDLLNQLIKEKELLYKKTANMIISGRIR